MEYKPIQFLICGYSNDKAKITGRFHKVVNVDPVYTILNNVLYKLIDQELKGMSCSCIEYFRSASRVLNIKPHSFIEKFNSEITYLEDHFLYHLQKFRGVSNFINPMIHGFYDKASEITDPFIRNKKHAKPIMIARHKLSVKRDDLIECYKNR